MQWHDQKQSLHFREGVFDVFLVQFPGRVAELGQGLVQVHHFVRGWGFGDGTVSQLAVVVMKLILLDDDGDGKGAMERNHIHFFVFVIANQALDHRR